MRCSIIKYSSIKYDIIRKNIYLVKTTITFAFKYKYI